MAGKFSRSIAGLIAGIRKGPRPKQRGKQSPEAQPVQERVQQPGSPGDAELVCPRCGSHPPAPIVYGIPTPLLMPLFLEGKIAAGGAMGRLLSGHAPTWECRSCRYQWRGGLYAGGSGDSFEHAVIIAGITSTAVGIRAEKQYLTERFGLEQEVAAPQPGWRLENQVLYEMLWQGASRHYDELTIMLPDGTQRTVIFDITSFFGKRP